MQSRFNSLKVRTALALSAVLVLLLLLNAAILIPRAWREQRRGIESTARVYARLTTRPLCEAYSLYYASGFLKFRELAGSLLRDSPDVTAIRIVDVEGAVLFDSTALEAGAPSAQPARTLPEGPTLEAVRQLDPSFLPDGLEGDGFQIVSPFIEEWGRHQLSVIYHFSYANARPRILQQIYTTGGVAIAAVGAALLLGVLLTNRITRPLELLTRGARAIAEGRFDQPIEVRSGDELQVLADTFNHMASELSESISQLQLSAESLAAANRELSERNAELEQFAHTMSHDLKTPLVTIRGFCGFLEDHARKGDMASLQRDLGRISAAAGHMQRLLDELLSFSRAGRLVTREPLLLGELARTAIDNVRMRHPGAAFEAVVADDLPTLSGDRARLLEALEGLVDTAVTFGRGRAGLRVEVGRRAEAKGHVIYVHDNGIGIDPAYHPKVFGLFEKLDPRSEGNGVGLTLVRKIVEAHGGHVWLESEGAGKGTTVILAFPDAPPGEPNARGLATADRPTSGT
jgi:signal transduction histidine kinase